MDQRSNLPRGKYGPAKDPTTDEITERCLQVQATWDERQRRNRAGMTEFLWEPPRIAFLLDRQCVIESFT